MVKQRFYTHLAAAGLLALAALAWACVRGVQAGPPAPVDIPITQPDGTTLTVRQWGDERQHGLETLDGYTLVLDEASGFYAYAARAEDGTLAPARADGQLLIAGQDAPLGLMPQLRPEPLPEMDSLFSAPALADSAAGPPAQASGKIPILVLLVDFPDQHGYYSPTNFQQKIFGASGSVRDYYFQASFEQLTFTPAQESSDLPDDGVVGWLRLEMPHPNLNPNDKYYSANLVAASESIARAALTKAGTWVNFTAYDTDGDDYVTAKELQVVIIAAGYEHSYNTGNSPGLWAHQRDLNNPLKLGSVYLGQGSADGDWGGYSLFGEIHGDHIAQIGVMAHEIGHLLGLPDLYDTDTYPNWEGVGNWSVMGSGSWNKVADPLYGGSPALPDAWLKWYMGWLTPANSPSAPNYTQIMIPNADENPYALLLGKNSNGLDWRFFGHSGTGQYWLVENRQRTGYDAGLPGCGLLIWHVHEDVSPYNDANANPAYPLLALEQADGLGQLNFYNQPYSNRGDSGDPYYQSSHMVFGPNTNPNSNYSNIDQTQVPSNYTLALEKSGCYSTTAIRLTQLSMLKTFLPVVVRGPLNATGIVTSGGAPLSGQTVQIMYSTDNGDSYAPYGSPTVTDAAGMYALPLPSLTGGGTKYFVLWNNSANNSLLSRFECNPRTGADTVHTCDMEVSGGINLLSPSPGAAITITPGTIFMWTRRSYTTDSYALQLYFNNSVPWVFSDYLGYTDRFTLTNAPSGATQGTTYRWSVRVRTASGVGFAYANRTFTFGELSSPPLEEAPAIAPGPGWNGSDEKYLPEPDPKMNDRIFTPRS